MVRIHSKCHINTTLVVLVELASDAVGDLPGMFPQQLPTAAVASRLKLSAGYTEDSSVITWLWCLHSGLFQKGTGTHPELLDAPEF